jgi:hypothetical protein
MSDASKPLPGELMPDMDEVDHPGPPNRLQQAITHSNPNLPRQIRARTGEAKDPLPEGKKPASPKLHSGVLKALADHEEARHNHALQPKDWPKEVQKQHTQAIDRAHGFTPLPDKAMPWHMYTTHEGATKRGMVSAGPNKLMDSRRAHHGVYEGRHPRTTFAGSFPASSQP